MYIKHCILKTFKGINDNLANMQKFIATNNESHFLRPIYYKQKNPFLIMELKILKKQHLMVSNAVQMLNMIFSLQLLATTVITFSQTSLILSLHIVQEIFIVSGYFSWRVFSIIHSIPFYKNNINSNKCGLVRNYQIG